VRLGYRQGVPMGGDLPQKSDTAKAPTFIVWAIKDPDSGNLDRIQIVKGWTKNGQTFEKIYNVALSGNRKVDPRTGRIPHVGNTVNLRTATYKNSIGARSLSVVWTDQNFDPTVAAFYYVRVLEIPTPRWSTYDAVRLKVALPHGAPPTIQERAYTSPIWFTPSKRDAERGRKGAITEASLKAQGAKALGDAEIKKLLVGWTLVARNRVTGEVFEALYGTDGKRELRNLTIPQSGIVGFQSMHGGGRIATIAPYKIKGGQLITTFNKRSFAVRIYKLGNNYYGARNNEFGFVNYELVWRN